MDINTWRQQNNLTWQEFADMVGTDPRSIRRVLDTRSPHTSVTMAMAIQRVTGLEFHEFLDGLDALKKLKRKTK